MARRIIGTAWLQVKADTRGFESGLGGVAGRLRGRFSALTGAIAGLGLGHLASQAITFGAEYRTQLDNAKAAILGLTDSQGEADTLMKAMTTEAIQTPFTLPGVTEMTTRLLALGQGFGVTSGNVVGWVDDLGNAAAATGKTTDNMNNVINIMGRISGQGRIMGRDMTQLSSNLPSLHPWEILADVTGKSESSLRKLALKPGGLTGIVDTTKFMDALRVGIQQLPGAAKDATTGMDAMDRKMATLGGTVEFFKDTIGVALADGLVPFFNAIIQGMKSQETADGLNKLIANFSELATAIVTAVLPALPSIINGFSSIVKALVPLAPAVGALALLFGAVMQAIAPFIAVIAEVIGWVGKLLAKLDPSLLKVIGVALVALFFAPSVPIGILIVAIAALAGVIAYNWDAIVAATQVMVDAVVAAWDWLFKHVIDPVKKLVQDVIKFFTDLYDTLVGHSIIPDLVNAIIRWFNVLANFVKAIVNGIKTVVLAIWNAIKSAVTTVVTAIVNFVRDHWKLLIAIISGPLGIIVALVIRNWNTIRTFLSAVWSGIKATASAVWSAIKTAIVNPITSAWHTIQSIVGWIRDKISNGFAGVAGVVSGIWNGVKNAILGPLRSAWGSVSSLVGKIKNAVQGAIDKVSSVAHIGGNFNPLNWGAEGGVFTRPTIMGIGEAGPEALVPMRNPVRAMQVMHQAGLDRLAASMGGGRGNGPLVQMNGTVIQDATDADLVAQRTLVAMQAAMVA